MSQIEKRNILCFINKSNFSGATKLTLELLENLDNTRFEKRILFFQYAPEGYRKILGYVRSTRIPYTIIKKIIPDGLISLPYMGGLNRILVRLFYPILLKSKLGSLMKNFDYDILYSNTDHVPELPNFWNKFRHRFFHFHLNNRSIDRNPTFTGSRVDLLNLASRVIAVSDKVKQSLQNRGVSPRILMTSYPSITNVTVNRESVDQIRRSFDVKETNLVIGACGVISERKGTDIFVKMADTLTSEYPMRNLKFLWIGGGHLNNACKTPGDWPQMERICRKLDGHFYFTDTVPNPYDFFSILDIFVVCSRSEGLPLVMLENMYLGKPVVVFADLVSDVEHLDGCICRVNQTDHRALAEKVYELVKNQEDRSEYGKRGRECVLAHFDTRKRALELEELFLRGSLT